MLRLETGDWGKAQRCSGMEGVADGKIAVVGNAQDVSGKGFVDDFAFVGKEFVGPRQAYGPAALGVDEVHAALEAPGANSQKGHAVAVPGVHVGLNFEDEAGKIG